MRNFIRDQKNKRTSHHILKDSPYDNVFTEFQEKVVLNYTVSVSVWMSPLSREGYLLFQKGVWLRRPALQSIIAEAEASERLSGPAQWWPLWTEGIQSPQQDKVKGNWPAWSFCREGGRAHPFIFSQRPWSHSTNKIVSTSSLDLWSPLEQGDVQIQGGSGPGGQSEKVTWDRQASGAGKEPKGTN